MFTRALLQALDHQPDLLHHLSQQNLRPQQTLSILTQLRKHYPPDLAAAALETARLRLKGRAKFHLADQLFFTDSALQQASSESVAAYHADLLRPYRWVADLGCGIGGDALQIGQVTSVLGLDLDPVRLWMARHNAQVYGAQAEFIQTDLTQPLPFGRIVEALFFDPARRDQEKRIFSLRDYQPPLRQLREWAYRAGLVKISPGVQWEELHHLPFQAGIAFISLAGELKECLLHLGELAFDGPQAVLLPQGLRLQSQGLPAPPLSPQPLAYLYEPDSAVIRAGLFGELAALVPSPLYRLDESIAYLTSDSPIESPWLRGWPIHGWMPFQLKKLRAALTQLGVGRVTIKKRGSPMSPEELEHLLSLKKGPRHTTLFMTQLAGRPIALWSLD
jgi:hypothetical protein